MNRDADGRIHRDEIHAGDDPVTADELADAEPEELCVECFPDIEVG